MSTLLKMANISVLECSKNNVLSVGFTYIYIYIYIYIYSCILTRYRDYYKHDKYYKR